MRREKVKKFESKNVVLELSVGLFFGIYLLFDLQDEEEFSIYFGFLCFGITFDFYWGDVAKYRGKV